LGAAIGSCVHVAGILRFLTLAEEEGYETIFLGTAVSIDELIEKVKEHNPDIIGVSYRLTAASVVTLLEDLKNAVIEAGLEKKRWVFGCTAPIKQFAERTNLFEEIFTGFSTDEDTISFLRGRKHISPETRMPPKDSPELPGVTGKIFLEGRKRTASR
jgi:methylmalonyl-CoA mutase cobalamin-binding subunit